MATTLFSLVGVVFTNDPKMKNWANAHLGMDSVILKRMYRVLHLPRFSRCNNSALALSHGTSAHPV